MAISSNDLILVTGGNGFVGSVVVDRLLKRGTTVRTTVRSESSAEALNKVYGDQIKAGQLEIVYVPVITEAGAFDAAAKGTRYVIHVASPIPGPGKHDVEKDFLAPAIEGTLTLLKSAQTAGTVEKVVLTSSIAAVFDPSRQSVRYTGSDWNPTTREQAIEFGNVFDTDPRASMVIYATSKKLAEKAAWDFVQQAGNPFKLTTINPVFILGAPVLPDGRAGTNDMFIHGLNTAQPGFASDGWVDVRDVADAHINALTHPESDGKRYIASAAQLSTQQALDIAQKLYPQKYNKKAEADKPKEEWNSYDDQPITELLGGSYIPIEQSVADFLNHVHA